PHHREPREAGVRRDHPVGEEVEGGDPVDRGAEIQQVDRVPPGPAADIEDVERRDPRRVEPAEMRGEAAFTIEEEFLVARVGEPHRGTPPICAPGEGGLDPGAFVHLRRLISATTRALMAAAPFRSLTTVGSPLASRVATYCCPKARMIPPASPKTIARVARRLRRGHDRFTGATAWSTMIRSGVSLTSAIREVSNSRRRVR